MRIKLRGGQPASEDAILVLEADLGFQLSQPFRGFLRFHDGAEPETNIFEVGDNNDSGVNEFIPVSQILEARARVENIPWRKVYPVARAEGGNYILIDEDKAGAVFFWDHEIPDKPTRLADDFGGFLDLLAPFDIKSVRLKPGQVKRVWVDPEFLKRIKSE